MEVATSPPFLYGDPKTSRRAEANPYSTNVPEASNRESLVGGESGRECRCCPRSAKSSPGLPPPGKSRLTPAYPIRPRLPQRGHSGALPSILKLKVIFGTDSVSDWIRMGGIRCSSWLSESEHPCFPLQFRSAEWVMFGIGSDFGIRRTPHT